MSSLIEYFFKFLKHFLKSCEFNLIKKFELFVWQLRR